MKLFMLITVILIGSSASSESLSKGQSDKATVLEAILDSFKSNDLDCEVKSSAAGITHSTALDLFSRNFKNGLESYNLEIKTTGRQPIIVLRLEAPSQEFPNHRGYAEFLFTTNKSETLIVKAVYREKISSFSLEKQRINEGTITEPKWVEKLVEVVTNTTQQFWICK